MVRIITAAVLIAGVCGFPQRAPDQNTEGEILLIVRSDDMGAAHAINEACLQSVTKGIARSIEVLVPAPWFLESGEMLRMEESGADRRVRRDSTSPSAPSA